MRRVGHVQVDASRSGDRLRALYDEMLPIVFGFCRARLPLHDAEDVCADVFRSAAELLQREPDRELTVGWFLTVARNRVVDRWRRDARWSARLDSVAGELDPGVDHEPRERSEGSDTVLAALDSLPAAQRAAVVLHWIEGRPVRETAGVLGRSEHATE